ncbi:HEAT repeat domain-containing protein [Hyalangium versicolor]|uniref:HEAT repeat domain-containing protein n=1 Tax=Hyalangium versicolor TaxID=2861190 RepID=UPI001CD00A68|nr:HEAT repeat domain-containing protein [Hyalangium versicolor]
MPESHATSPAPAATPAPANTLYTFEGVEVFGSRKVSKQELLDIIGIGLPPAGTRIDVSQDDFFIQLKKSKKQLIEKWPFALCRYSEVRYPEQATLTVTVNLVDVGDEWRMRFSPAPQGNVPDPEGLIAAWQDYLGMREELRRAGEIPDFGEGTCAAIVCIGGFAHPKLEGREQKFIEGVPRNFETLLRVVREDRDNDKRMFAAMLLAYAPSREKVVEALVPSIRDPYDGVRNEVLRLLGAAQLGQKRVIVPLEPVLEALWFPLVSDRNKAGWALVRIVETEGAVHRQQILEKSGEMLLQMVGMHQRTDHEPAQKVLTVLAGRDLGLNESAWRRWAQETQAASTKP